MPAIWRAWKSSKHCSGVNDMAEQHGKALVPQIRFAGFTDPWEQRKLGELYKEVSEKNDLTYGRDRIISVAHMYFNPVVYVTEDDYLKTYNVMRLGDIAFEGNRSKNFTHGRLVENTIGDGIVSHVFKVFRPIRPFDLMYWKYSINNEKAMKDVLTRSTKASTMMHELVAKDFLNEEIAVPSLEEQRQIGAFFDRLDSLITLHQRKYDKLCVLKKSMLDKMFPKGGSLYPEIRFAGFTDPWEQRKLGEVARRVTRKNENRDSDLPLTISAQYGLVDQRTFFNNQVASKDMSGYFLLRKGEFAYNKSTSTDSPWGAIKRLEKYDMGCVSTLYICFELLSGDPDFLVTYYETDRWYKAVQLIAAEGARNHGLLNIAPDDFFETQICIPKRIDEQRQIGAFFDRLDSLITLHQRKYCGVVSWMLGVALVRLSSEK
ncbi:restriction endonuclease subunit S [Bifidobacterium adolescentis]|nr:restriction endonuclease subunit S [Bifidobacterium adolescentis]